MLLVNRRLTDDDKDEADLIGPCPQIWLPNRRPYVALGHEGRGVAWVGKTYVMPSPDVFVELPGYRDTGAAAGGPRRGSRTPVRRTT